MKEESERAGLKLNMNKTKSMSSGPIISCQIEGGNVEIVTDLLFLGSKITEDGEIIITAALKSEDVCFLAGKL